jgi:nitrogen-specific signal transduction histidine kinase
MRPEASYRFQRLRDGQVPRLAPPPDLTQALLNLLNNAADACPDDLEVRLDWDAQDIVISIRDHGPGVPLAIAEADRQTLYYHQGQRLRPGPVLEQGQRDPRGRFGETL